MYFTKEQVDELTASLDASKTKHTLLQKAFIECTYASDRSKEFAHHGLLRRMQTLQHCITRVFTLIPPSQNGFPACEALEDAEVYIQAFVFNLFGALDNLAWIWAEEAQILKPNGSPLSARDVSIRSGPVYKSLPASLSEHVDHLHQWFELIENFRHALAHRIPLYIVPYVVLEKDHEAYHQFDNAILAAEAAGQELEAARLRKAQQDLTIFRPWMQHSFSEGSDQIVFHYQMLNDFNTIDKLARALLVELNHEPHI